jgi:hypothetical protein
MTHDQVRATFKVPKEFDSTAIADGISQMAQMSETWSKAAQSLAAQLQFMLQRYGAYFPLEADLLRARWEADAAEWLTLYLQTKGAASTKQIKQAYRMKSSLHYQSFSDLRKLAHRMQLIEGTTWELPADHPLVV